MSASLVRKALDETTSTSTEKVGQLSKTSKKFKPQKKKQKVSEEKILKQNLKFLKALDCKLSSKTRSSGSVTLTQNPSPIKSAPPPAKSSLAKIKKSKSSKKSKRKEIEGESVFTEEDFEKFEKEYFVS